MDSTLHYVKTRTVQFRIEGDDVESLDDLCKVTRVSRSVFLREAIDDLLRKYKSVLADAKAKGIL